MSRLSDSWLSALADGTAVMVTDHDPKKMARELLAARKVVEAARRNDVWRPPALIDAIAAYDALTEPQGETE